LAPWRALRQIDANAPFDGVAVAMGPAAWRDGRLDRRVCVQGRSATWPGDREVLAVVLVDGSGSVCLAGEREARCGRATVGEVHLREPADTWWAPRRLCAREAVGWARVDDP
jgi:hypothetical protein